MRVTVGNLKGGVAKSTTAVFLAAGLSRARRVLLVDADATNRTALHWSAAGDAWPEGIALVGREVPDLPRRVAVAERDYDHIVIDTGPETCPATPSADGHRRLARHRGALPAGA